MSLSLSFEEASNLQLLSLHVAVEGYKAPSLPTESFSSKLNHLLRPVTLLSGEYPLHGYEMNLLLAEERPAL